MTRWTVALLTAATLIPVHLAGQSPEVAETGPRVSTYATQFASLSGTPSPLPHVDSAATTLEVAAPQLRGRSSKAYMIAGAAALVAGLLIDGDVGTLVAVGGVAIGVYGILLYY